MTDNIETYPEQTSVTDAPSNKRDGELEVILKDLLHASDGRTNLKEMLQQIIQDELSRMSVVLKQAIQDWVRREKEKVQAVQASGENLQLEADLESLKEKNESLEEEVKKMKRQLELKQHENMIMMQGLKRAMSKK